MWDSNNKPPSPEKQKWYAPFTFINDAMDNIGSSVLSKCMVLAAFFVAARKLGPADYGVWAMFSLIIYWSLYINLGSGAIMLRELASCPAGIRREYREEIRNKTLTLTLLLIAAGIAIFYSSIGALLSLRNPLCLASVHGVGIIIVLQQLYTYLQYYWWGTNNFQAVAILRMFYAATASSCIALLLFFWSIEAVIIGVVCGYLCAIVYTLWRYPVSFRLHADKAFFKKILRAGLPFMGVGMAQVLLQTSDRALVYSHLGKKVMGWYSIASTISDVLFLISLALAQVIYTRMVAAYSAHQSVKPAVRILVSSVDLFSNGMTLLFLWTWYLVPVLLPRLLPHYLPGILPAIISSQAIIMFSLTTLCGHYFLATGHPRRYLALIIIGCVVKMALIQAALRYHAGLSAIALINVAIYAGLFLAAWGMCGTIGDRTFNSFNLRGLRSIGVVAATAGVYLLDRLPCCAGLVKTVCVLAASVVLSRRVVSLLKKINSETEKTEALTHPTASLEPLQ